MDVDVDVDSRTTGPRNRKQRQGGTEGALVWMLLVTVTIGRSRAKYIPSKGRSVCRPSQGADASLDR